MDNMNNQQNYGPVPDSQDGGNKALAALSYPFWIVAVIAFFVKKDESPYVKFHAIQAIALAIISFVISALVGVLNTILSVIIGIIQASVDGGGILNLIPMLVGLVGTAAGIAVFVLMIIGLINAIQGTMKPLPLIGEKINEKFNK